jgi:hypothetical protein
MNCTICQHPQRQALDLALLNRTATLARLSEQHRLSTSAQHRHKQHLLHKKAQAQNRFQDIMREGYLFILNELLASVWRAARTAEAEGNSRLLLQAVRQGTGIMKFMAKLDSSFSAETVRLLLASPQTVEAGSLLPTNPEFVVKCRQALADSLFGPCPELGSPEAALVDGRLSEAAQGASADLLPLLAGLSQSLGEPGSGPHPAGRKKGGKKPGKTPCQNLNHHNIQQDKLAKKILGLDVAGLAEAPPSKNGNPRFAALLQECADQGKIPAHIPLSEFIYEQSLRAGRIDQKPWQRSAMTVNRPEKGNGTAPLAA